MKVLIDLLHPAHVHFFRNPIRLLSEAGHEVRVTSRDKDCTLELLDEYGIEHQCISGQNSGGLLGMARELLVRDRELMRVARQFRPHVLTGIGGVCVAQVGRLLGIPSVVFYDTETARLQNTLTFPFATRIVVPECYAGKLPKRKAVRYRGYHELSYLHPDYFQPSREIALANGLAPDGDTFLVRLVSWKASHDIGLRGWSAELLDAVVGYLSERGTVVISAEGTLPAHLEKYQFDGNPAQIHHLLAFCRVCIGEGATLASESAMLGVPAVYASRVSLSYLKEQAERYGMAEVTASDDANAVIAALDRMLAVSSDRIEERHQRLLEETVDVARMVVEQLCAPEPVRAH